MPSFIKNTDVKNLIVWLFLSNITLIGIIYGSIVTDIKNVETEVKEIRKDINGLAIKVAEIRIKK